MSYLLGHAWPALTPLLHPDLPAASHRLLAGIAALVLEYGTERGTHAERGAQHIGEIAADRLSTRLSRDGLLAALPEWAPRTLLDPDAPLDAEARKALRAAEARLDRALAAARAHGVITSEYAQSTTWGCRDNHPTLKIVPVVDAALARAAMRRDAIAHLTVHPLDVIRIDGVAIDARPLNARARQGREFERTVEIIRPTTPANAADALLRKVDLEYVGILGGVEYPRWRPDGLAAARELRAVVEELTGAPMTVTPPPVVAWVGPRIVVTPEMETLVPALRRLRPEMRAVAPAAPTAAVPAAPVAAAARPIERSARQPRPKGGVGTSAGALAVITRRRAQRAEEEAA